MKPIRPLVEGREVVVATPEMTVTEAARLMSDRRIGALPVVDGARVAGIFTERDALSRVLAAGLNPSAARVGAVMTTSLVVADVSDTHSACMSRMQQAHVRHLLVLDQGRLVGILSVRDLIQVEMREQSEAIDLLNAYVHYVPGDTPKDGG